MLLSLADFEVDRDGDVDVEADVEVDIVIVDTDAAVDADLSSSASACLLRVISLYLCCDKVLSSLLISAYSSATSSLLYQLFSFSLRYHHIPFSFFFSKTIFSPNYFYYFILFYLSLL